MPDNSRFLTSTLQCNTHTYTQATEQVLHNVILHVNEQRRLSVPLMLMFDLECGASVEGLVPKKFWFFIKRGLVLLPGPTAPVIW